MIRILGVGDYFITDNPDDQLKTFGLGSCVALAVYCPIRKLWGLVHIALPDSGLDHEKSRQSPGYFADTAVPFLIAEMCRLGCIKNGLIIHLFGGAQAVWAENSFNIGNRNLKTIRKILENYGLSYHASETGGQVGRTVVINVAQGNLEIIRHPLTAFAEA